MEGSVLEEKSSLKILGLSFSSKLNWGLILSLLLKRHPRKLEPSFILLSFFLLRLPCISINLPYGLAWNCCHVWAGAPSCYLEMLDKLQKRICGTVGPSLTASLEPLAHRQNVARLSLFCRYYFARCSSELAQLVSRPCSQGRSAHCSDILHDFFSPFLDVKRMSMSTPFICGLYLNRFPACFYLFVLL